MRAATPSMSGSVANSRTLTRITLSRSGIGAGNGSLVCPGGSGAGGVAGGCAAAEAATPNTATTIVDKTMRIVTSLPLTSILLDDKIVVASHPDTSLAVRAAAELGQLAEFR